MPFSYEKASKKASRLHLATDLHGSERTFRKFIDAGKACEVGLAEERLNGAETKSLVTGGNDDEWDVLSVMKRKGEYAEGVLRGCLVTFVDGEVKGFQMTIG